MEEFRFLFLKGLMILVLVVYLLALGFVLIYSLTQGRLAWSYSRRNASSGKGRSPVSELPMLTVQLPVYNEQFVIERLIDSVAALDYPSDRLEIQLLDDSNDATVELAAARIAHWQEQGLDICHIRRSDRSGFKAGALKYGLRQAKGEFIAIFDADFLPSPDFLKKCLAEFDSAEVGMVQTKWQHINRDYSLMTRVQAFALDAHFTVEQSGRNALGAFMNFNGTAGVWRKECILDAGDWSHDTLTEDLDLSYRAQLRGWKFKYLQEVETPSELPPVMPAIKSQQYRWSKGGAETARKHLWNVLNSDQPLHVKWHGLMHLLNSGIFLSVLLSAFMSVPLVLLKPLFPEMSAILQIGYVFMSSLLVVIVVYYLSNRTAFRSSWKALLYYIFFFPVFLCVSMGMSLHNGLATLSGFAGRKSAFVRTPKFNITGRKDALRRSLYFRPSIDAVTWLEGIMACYFGYGLYCAVQLQDFGMVPFLAMLVVGYLIVFGFGIGHYIKARIS